MPKGLSCISHDLAAKVEGAQLLFTIRRERKKEMEIDLQEEINEVKNER